MRMKEEDTYRPYTSLFDEGRLAYLTSRSITLSDSPAGDATLRVFEPQDQNTSGNEHWTPEIDVIGRAEITTRDSQTGLRTTKHWLKINIMDQPSCEGPTDDPKTIATGWISAYRNNGDVSAWFYSRGC